VPCRKCPVRVLAIFPFHRATEDTGCAGGHSCPLIIEGEDQSMNAGEIIEHRQNNVSNTNLDVDYCGHP
jgi:hypothetical protein